MKANQRPVSAARWQHGRQKCFATWKKSQSLLWYVDGTTIFLILLDLTSIMVRQVISDTCFKGKWHWENKDSVNSYKYFLLPSVQWGLISRQSHLWYVDGSTLFSSFLDLSSKMARQVISDPCFNGKWCWENNDSANSYKSFLLLSIQWGKSAASFCCQVAAWVPDMFCNLKEITKWKSTL